MLHGDSGVRICQNVSGAPLGKIIRMMATGLFLLFICLFLHLVLELRRYQINNIDIDFLSTWE